MERGGFAECRSVWSCEVLLYHSVAQRLEPVMSRLFSSLNFQCIVHGVIVPCAQPLKIPVAEVMLKHYTVSEGHDQSGESDRW
jgi:hypothetical protein